jgi:hypothetical protein
MKKSATFACCQCGEIRPVAGNFVACPKSDGRQAWCSEVPISSAISVRRRGGKKKRK